MADSLFRKILITVCAMVFICHSAYSYETSFPFPFEFGHSSDIYLNVKKPTKKQNADLQRANEILKERGISRSPDEITKYIKKDEAEKIKLLINAGLDPNGAIFVNTPVYSAAKHNSYNTLKVLLDNGAKPDDSISSPLREALKRKHMECARLLIENGADVNYYDGMTDENVLYTALKNNNVELAKLMIEKGAKMDKKTYALIKKKKLDKKYGLYAD